MHVSMHDIYKSFYPDAKFNPAEAKASTRRWPQPEGVQVFEWLTFSGAAAHVHTLAAGVGKVGACVQAARQHALQGDASIRLPTWTGLHGDYAASVYLELRPLTNSCEGCLA